MFIELELIEMFCTVPSTYKMLLLFVTFTVNVVFDKIRRSVVNTVKLPF